jgi:hypothetical protein
MSIGFKQIRSWLLSEARTNQADHGVHLGDAQRQEQTSVDQPGKHASDDETN